MKRKRRGLPPRTRALALIYGYGLRLWEWDLWPGQLTDDRTLGYVAQGLHSRRAHALSDSPLGTT